VILIALVYLVPSYTAALALAIQATIAFFVVSQGASAAVAGGE